MRKAAHRTGASPFKAGRGGRRRQTSERGGRGSGPSAFERFLTEDGASAAASSGGSEGEVVGRKEEGMASRVAKPVFAAAGVATVVFSVIRALAGDGRGKYRERGRVYA